MTREHPASWYTLLRSVEGLVFDLGMTIVLGLNTFVRVLTKPWWPYAYIHEQLRLDESRRFQDHLSPFLFWLICGVLPAHYVVTEIISIGDAMVELLTLGGGSSHKWFSLSTQEQVLAVTSAAMFLPLTCAAMQALCRSKTLTTESMRGFLFAQAYVFGGLTALLAMMAFASSRLHYYFPGAMAPVPWTLATAWLAASHLPLYRRGFRYSWGKSLSLFVLSTAAGAVLAYKVMSWVIALVE